MKTLKVCVAAASFFVGSQLANMGCGFSDCHCLSANAYLSEGVFGFTDVDQGAQDAGVDAEEIENGTVNVTSDRIRISYETGGQMRQATYVIGEGYY